MPEKIVLLAEGRGKVEDNKNLSRLSYFFSAEGASRKIKLSNLITEILTDSDAPADLRNNLNNALSNFSKEQKIYCDTLESN